jgi:hypothetical protein
VSPTFEWPPRFAQDLKKLSDEDAARFREKVLDQFVPALAAHAEMPPGLRVKGVQGANGVFELTFAPDGRATFEYGEELVQGEVHVIWRRIGTHVIFGNA